MTKARVKTPLELAFDSVALECGGHITSDLHPYQQRRATGDPPDDADYFFPRANTLAELKRLGADTFALVNDPRIVEMSARWIRSGLIGPPRSKHFKWHLPELPEPCQREAIAFFRRPIRRVVKKANAQIKQTKAILALPDCTNGLLLLASDGNTVLDPQSVIILLARTFAEAHFRSVHSLVYFNYTNFADSPAMNSDVIFWIHSDIREPGVPESLLHGLEGCWSRLIQARHRRTMQRVAGNETLLADLNFRTRN